MTQETEHTTTVEASGPSEFRRVRAELEAAYERCDLAVPLTPGRYDPGDRVEYEVTGVMPAVSGRVVGEVERFVGGGFAGQVYRVRLIEVEGGLAGLEVGSAYALKIITPPSAFANLFRDLLYAIGYQSAFSPRVEPAAVRVGVLWQKLIRRAMELETGAPDAVCDTYATLYDANLKAWGEINEWVDGRTWKFEVDAELFERWDFQGEPPPDQSSPEYVYKKLFMRRLVALLHEMGAAELARQYEWWSLKSQPNALKRVGRGEHPAAGLTAIDFRAGLALLPFLPMSPVDVWLILRGLARGRLVQFDRADMPRLKRFLAARAESFDDLAPAIAELEVREREYRASMPDVTHQGLRLLVDPELRRSVKRGKVTAWKSLGRLDDEHAARVLAGRLMYPLLFLLSIVPFLGPALIRLWGDAVVREHVGRCVTSPSYLWRAMRGARVSALVGWARQGRVSAAGARRLVGRPGHFWAQRLGASWLPPSWHRAIADPGWGWEKAREGVRNALRFLREPGFREEALRDQIRRGESDGMLTAEEAERILGQVKDPYIQKYLRFLAVHMCTVPVTQVVMVLVGAGVVGYCLSARGLSWPESLALGTAAAATVQLLPISPGSLTRGIFVLFLMIKERDVKNYWVAAPVSFLHVIGYLAFPLQMVTHHPALARFLAGRWVMGAVRFIPVFGERGALLEHAVFDALFNFPISAARGFRRRPLRWIAAALLLLAVLGVGLTAGVARIWEWRQPRVELEGAVVESVEPYRVSLSELHWNRRGARVRLDGVAGVVDFPASRWDPSIDVGDHASAVVRKSFFGGEYDGLAIEPATPPAE